MTPIPSISELRRVCQAPVAGAALRHDPVYRWGSIYLTRVALRLGLSANQVTVLSLALGLGAAGALLDLTPARLALAAILLQGYFLLDYVDGEVARFRRTAGLAGRFLEQVGANAVDPFILAALGFGVAEATGGAWPAALGVVGAISLPTFRSLAASVSAVILAVRLARGHRSFGEATPEPTDDVQPSAWGPFFRAILPVYARLRFPFFHPNFVLGASILAALDAVACALGAGVPCSWLEVTAFGVGTPVFVTWQVLNIVHLHIAEDRYRRAFVDEQPFREHV